MSTKNPRINMTFEQGVVTLLTDMAKKAHQSMASLVNELTLEALERREDIALSALADARDVPTAKKIKHEDAWK